MTVVDGWFADSVVSCTPTSVTTSTAATTSSAAGSGGASVSGQSDNGQLTCSISTPTALDTGVMVLVVGIVVAAALLAGWLIVFARQNKSSADPSASVVRSWIAITLVLGLVIFAAVTFGVDDTAIRNTLLGGLTTSAGGAIAYYFSSKSADQARQDLLAAFTGSEDVPNLFGKTVDQARLILGNYSLKLVVRAENSAIVGATIQTQDQPAGSSVPKGSKVTVTLNGTAPTVNGLLKATGVAAGAETVVITGLLLAGAQRVTFGGSNASNLTVDSDFQITVTSPPGTAGDVVDVLVTTPAGTSAPTAASKFTYK